MPVNPDVGKITKCKELGASNIFAKAEHFGNQQNAI